MTVTAGLTANVATFVWLRSCYDSRNQGVGMRDSRLESSHDFSSPAQLTIDLLRRAGDGDEAAMNGLFERLAPPLQRWARGRLPGWARGMVDTTDLVQETLFSTFKLIERKEISRDVAIHAYVRKALKNRLIDELRKVQRRPELDAMNHSYDSGEPSPLDEVIGSEALQRYETALENLNDKDRDAVVARIELGLPYAEIATLLGQSSPDAARMTVGRALLKLAGDMGDD